VLVEHAHESEEALAARERLDAELDFSPAPVDRRDPARAEAIAAAVAAFA